MPPNKNFQMETSAEISPARTRETGGWREDGELQRSERPAIERELRFYKSLFMDAPIAYIVTDESMHILEANSAALHLINRSMSELRGAPISMIIAGDNRSVFDENAARLALQRKLRAAVLLTPLHRDAVNVSLTACISDNGDDGLIRVHWLFHDQSESESQDFL